MFGGGASTVLDMIIRMRNNRALLHKRGHDYFKDRKKEFEHVHVNSQSEAISDEAYHYNLERSRKNQRYDSWVSAFSIILALLFLVAAIIGLIVKLDI